MSHELRTPLNAILGYTELILDDIYGELPDKMRAVLERVQSNGKHLLGLINDVLDLSKIEAGQLTLSLADYSIKDVVHTVFSAVEPLATEKQLALKVEVPPTCRPATATSAASRRCCSTWSATPSSSPTRARSRSRRRAANGSFTVAGARHRPRHLPRPTRPRSSRSSSRPTARPPRRRAAPGSGLAISKRIVETARRADLGRIRRSGKGSTFSFTLPVRVEQQARHA